MIRFERGNLLKAGVDALVNTVNCVGVMGKGVALQFKQAYPANTKAYEVACSRDEVQLGRMFVTYTGQLEPRLIINFPTKRHWKSDSRLEDIERGLEDLVRVVREEQVRSIAIPPLGCGLGGLRWEDVRPRIVRAFDPLPDVEVRLFEPIGAIEPEDRIVNTLKPPMTSWRAAIIMVVDAYRALGCDATHLEAQKLLYFLVEAGEPLKANFQKGAYGPYDQGMAHGLQSMDGHYLVGFGDGGRLEPVRLKPGALEEAERFVASQPEAEGIRLRVNRVTSLIEGFETPYGLELLATVHWLVTREQARTLDVTMARVHAWSERKHRLMEREHVLVARNALVQGGWLPESTA